MTERKFDEMGNPIDPDVASNKGLKLGICGHETCSYNVGVIWRDVKNNRYVCEACAKDKNRLWGEGTCITERTSALEAAITYDPKHATLSWVIKEELLKLNLLLMLHIFQ